MLARYALHFAVELVLSNADSFAFRNLVEK